MVDVDSHYEALARVYPQEANRHAQERYRLEVLSWLQDCHRVLDAGCGTAHLLAELRADLNIIGIDASLPMLMSGPGVGAVAASTAEVLPFADHTFDAVVSINLLEHVGSPKAVLLELSRVLAPDGRMVLTTPAAEWSLLLDMAEKLHLKLPEGPHRFLRAGELLAWAREAGFEPLVFRRILSLPFGGRGAARWLRALETRLPGLGFQHWLIARNSPA